MCASECGPKKIHIKGKRIDIVGEVSKLQIQWKENFTDADH